MVSFYESNYRYSEDKSFARALDEGRLTPDDRALIIEYIAECEASSSMSEHRRRKLAFDLVGLRRFLSIPYREASIADVYTAIAGIKAGSTQKGTPFRANTVRDYVGGFKPFLLWLIGEGHSALPEKKIRAIKVPPIDRQTTDPEDILTVDEMEAILRACRTARDRALIATLYESACRVAELGRLRWKDLVFDEWGTKVYIDDTKTQKRRYARLTMATQYLAELRNNYPGVPEGEARVFLMRGGKPISYLAARSAIRHAVTAAGITKRVHPHLFRKTRITHMISQNYNQSVIKESAWGNQDTGMLRTYIQLKENDMDREFLQRAGVVVEDEGDSRRLEQTCGRCHMINPPTNDFCGRCGNTLTGQADDAVNQAIRDLFAAMAKNPEIGPEVARILQEGTGYQDGNR